MRILQHTKEDEAKYLKFLLKHERSNFQQSLEWGNIKTNWIKEVIISEDEKGKIVGALCVWIRKIPLFGNIMYSARGPVCDIHSKEVLEDIVQGANELAKKYHAFVLRVEPDIKKSDKQFRDIATDVGFKIKDDSKNFLDEIQPRFVFQLNIKNKTADQVLAACHSKTRYNSRLASKKGVTIKEGTREDLKDFHKIMVETGKRDDFIIRSLDYFERMWDEFVPKGYMKLLMAYHEEKPIAGIIPIMFGNKVWYLYGASSNSHRNLMPNYLLQWTMIQEAIERKAVVYDFRGVSGVVGDGLYRFKSGFGAEFIEFIGEIYIPYQPTKYKLYKFAEKLFRQMRKLKKKLLK